MNRPPKRLKSKVKIKKKSYMKGLEGLTLGDMQYWRTFLKRSMIRKENIAMYIDPACVDMVEGKVRDAIREAQNSIYAKASRMFDIRNGEMAGGAARMLWPTLTSPTTLNMPGLADRIVWNDNFWIQRQEYRENHPAGSHLIPTETELAEAGIYRRWKVGGAFSIEITQQGGRTKIWITPSEFGDGVRVPMEPLDPPVRWNRTRGAFRTWLEKSNDDDLVQLWLEFKTSREIREELVRRAGDIHPSFPVKYSYAKLLSLRNSELRRAIVGFAEINWPEPFAVDDDGELIGMDEFINVLRVTCPSTGRVYHLGVPKDTHERRRDWSNPRGPGRIVREGEVLDTPRKARMWTLRLNEESLATANLKEEA
jgi:hypothetical protein